MISFVIWSALAAGIFLYNALGGSPFVGVRFTERWLGYPLDGGWLATAIALYCLARWWVRRRPRAAGGSGSR